MSGLSPGCLNRLFFLDLLQTFWKLLHLTSTSCLSQPLFIFRSFFSFDQHFLHNNSFFFLHLDPFLTLPVTAVFNLEPGFLRRYASTPFCVIPAPAFVGLLCPDLTLIPFISSSLIFCSSTSTSTVFF